MEAVDQRRDDLPITHRADQRILDCLEQVQVLDALCSPVSADLRAGHAPHFLCVGLEEDFVKTASEPVRDPLLEVILGRVRRHLGPEIAQADSSRFDRSESPQCVQRFQGVIEELVVVVDPGEPGALQEIVAEHLFPQLLDRRNLGEEPVPADIESIATILSGARDPANHRVLLVDCRGVSQSQQLIGRGETGRTGSDNDGLAHESAPILSRPTIAGSLPLNSRRG